MPCKEKPGIIHREVTRTLALNLDIERRKERRTKGFLRRHWSEGPMLSEVFRLLACPVVFSSLSQEHRHSLSVESVLPGEQKLPRVLGAGRRPWLLNHHPQVERDLNI